MTIREALAGGIAVLKSPSPSAFIDTPGLDASLLLGETLAVSRTELALRGNETFREEYAEKFRRLLERRRSGECVAYILGRREFRGLTFRVSPDVLVPRPETETLVEAALEYIDGMAGKNDGESISLLDLCTGSGALAVSLANERSLLQVTASDISAGALEIAAFNASRLLAGKSAVALIQSDLFENIPEQFNIIVSNPPYIPTEELSGLAPEVRHEPLLALDGGEDGLDLIRRISRGAFEHLLPGGILLLEADPKEMPAIKTLLERQNFGSIRVYQDLAGMDRVILAAAKSR